MTEYEMLELLLTYSISRIDVKPVARLLLNKFGCWHRIIAAPIAELTRIPGVGQNTAIFLKALHSASLRSYTYILKDAPIFHNHQILENYCKALLADKNIEEFHILYLDEKNQLTEDEIHASGTTDHAAVYPREIVRRAMDLNAAKIIVIHNHPNGSPMFSKEDIELTYDLHAMMKPLGMEVFDHLLVANGLVFSAKAMNCFNI
jgi:DNA repair protein RadC